METKDHDLTENTEKSVETTEPKLSEASVESKESPVGNQTIETSTIESATAPKTASSTRSRSKKGGIGKSVDKTKRYFKSLPKGQTAIWSAGLATVLVGSAMAIPVGILAGNAGKGSTAPTEYKSNYLVNFDEKISTAEQKDAANKDAIVSDKEVADAIESEKVKNEYLRQVKNDVKLKLDEYEKTNPGFKELKLQFITLSSAPSAQERLYFEEINKALRAIDPRLSFEMQDRTDTTLEEGYYKKNNEMVMFLWGPDFSSVATWLKYMMQDSFQVANMWPALWSKLGFSATETAIPSPVETGTGPADSKTLTGWEGSLKEYILENRKIKLVTKGGKNYLNEDIKNGTFEFNAAMDPTKISRIARYNMASPEDVYVSIANLISGWVVQNPVKEDGTALGIELVKWMNQFNNNIPYRENGPDTSQTWLVRDGLNIVQSPNSDMNFNDWYTTSGSSTVNYRWPHDLFDSATYLNPSFAEATNSIHFQSAQTNLATWVTDREYTDDNKKVKDTPVLQPTGATAIPKFKNGDDTGDVKIGEGTKYEETLSVTQKALEFEIRPIQWRSQNGIVNDQYLSPADFRAGFASFNRSLEIGINQNAYFLGMLGIDMERTLNYVPNTEGNTEGTEGKKFTVFFESPLLSATDTIDIFSKQYFSAAPAFEPTVQNIIDDEKFFKLGWKYTDKDGKVQEYTSKINDEGKTPIDKKESAKALAQCYATGDESNFGSFKDRPYYSAAPYYTSKIDGNKVTFEINDNYFNAFVDSTGYKPTKQYTVDGQIRNRVDTVVATYGKDSYNENTQITNFENGEVDWALVPGTRKSEILAGSLKTKVFEQFSAKASQGTVVGYNLQVYQKNDASQRFIDKDGKEFDAVSVDEFGNYVFDEDQQPLLKTRVEKEYNDLIVKDYYTPYYPGQPSKSGTSATIRTAINDLVDWYALAGIVLGGNTIAYQQSFMPYGVYDTTINDSGLLTNDIEDKFWSIASNQSLPGNSLNIYKTLGDPNNPYTPAYIDLVKDRNFGLTTWTYEELKWENQG